MSKRAYTGIETKSEHKSIQLKELYPVIQEVLDGGGSFSLTITGSSMWPTILGGRDRVTLIKPEKAPQKYDLPLYIRKSGQFVLHRIVAIGDDGSYTCCGDHQWILEKGIREEQIVGVVTDYTRKGKSFTDDNKRYRRYVRFWVRILPCRRAIFAVCGFLYRIKCYARAGWRKIFPKK